MLKDPFVSDFLCHPAELDRRTLDASMFGIKGILKKNIIKKKDLGPLVSRNIIFMKFPLRINFQRGTRNLMKIDFTKVWDEQIFLS